MPTRREGPTLSIALLLLTSTLLLLGPSVSAGAPATAPRIGPLASHCSGATIPSNLAGALIVQGGGSAPPPVANRSISVVYELQVNHTVGTSGPIYSCENRTTFATTDSLGDFAVNASAPASGCVPGSCTYYTGPYGPMVFGLPLGLPAGYFLTQSRSGSSVTLGIVAALASTALAPSARVTLSENASTVVHAFPEAGNGGPSPATLAYHWQLLGSRWSILSSANAANVTIVASSGAPPGSLTVWVNGSYNGTAVSAPPSTLQIASAPTLLIGAGTDRTSLDAGGSLLLRVSGTGAPGYPYVATIVPGLGLPFVPAPCTALPQNGGIVALNCSAVVTYPSAGLARPSVNLSNGYSTAGTTLLTITVAASLALSVRPSPLLTYDHVTQAVTVDAGPSSGTAPYGTACLWTGDGRLACSSGPGPSYSFPVDYGTPGPYEGRASVTDSVGANVSAPFSATVVGRPALDAIVVGSNQVNVGSSAVLRSALSGGAFPVEFWWNTTSPAGTLFAGELASAGPLLLTFTPHVSGLTWVNLTVRDALGTTLSHGVHLFVPRGPAVGIALSGSSSIGRATAGSALALSWFAEDPVGETVPSFNATVTVNVSSADARPPPQVWLNSSALGTVSGTLGGFALPAIAWQNGWLNVTLTLGRSGPFHVLVRSNLTVVGMAGDGQNLSVDPDVGHLLLRNPSVALAGARTNHTLYQILDRFGDPLAGGHILVTTDFGGVQSATPAPILVGPSASLVWVNFSAPDGLSGTVTVRSDIGALLASIVVPLPAGSFPLPLYGMVLGTGAAVAAGLAFALLRRRRPQDGGPELDEAPEVTEADLRRLSEGRAHILARADPWAGRTLDELSQGFPGRAPMPEEVTEWVASLVADGSLRTTLGPDGRSRFVRSRSEPPPRVELDDRALSEALKRRDESDPEEPRPPAGPG